MEMLKELGRRIQKARKEKKLTQQELADLSHVSLKHVQSCERGKKNPSFEVLRELCKVLNLSLDSLMNLDLPEDEQSANDMRQLYLSCPPAARKALLNSARALADELKEMTQADECDQDNWGSCRDRAAYTNMPAAGLNCCHAFFDASIETCRRCTENSW